VPDFDRIDPPAIGPAHQVQRELFRSPEGRRRRAAALVAVAGHSSSLNDSTSATGLLTLLAPTASWPRPDRIDAAAIVHFAEAIRPVAPPIADAAAQVLGELALGAAR
jgi:hypothetical protein